MLLIRRARIRVYGAAQLSFLREGDPVRSRHLLEQCLDQPFFEETTQA